jgi:hypothetical protein
MNTEALPFLLRREPSSHLILQNLASASRQGTKNNRNNCCTLVKTIWRCAGPSFELDAWSESLNQHLSFEIKGLH